MNVDHFIENYTKAIKEDGAAIFAGAGMSRGAGFVNWKELLRTIADELNLRIEKEEHDLVALAQYYCNEHRGRGRLNQIITDEFQSKALITENHRILSRLPISTYWTTNYDTLIETAMREIGKISDVKVSPENLAVTVNDRDAVVYKMHGDVSQVHKAIINRDDYERYELTHSLFTTALQGDLVSKTFLFIGFSFNDPNLNYILSRIRVRLEGNQRPHYCFLKKIKETDDDYEYARVKQELQVNDLKRFSINTILIDDYSDITTILKKIESRFKKNSVFISGSAVEYGLFSEDKAAELLHNLSCQLVRKDFRIISGFGAGVGSYIINGALEQLQLAKKVGIEKNLVLYPFPQKSSGGKSLEELWEGYRRRMLEEAGIAIFLFGNRKKDGVTIDAEGVKEEFEIATSLGLKIIPIGVTGYQTKKIYDQVIGHDDYFSDLNSIKPLLNILGQTEDIQSIVNTTIEIIEEIRRNA